MMQLKDIWLNRHLILRRTGINIKALLHKKKKKKKKKILQEKWWDPHQIQA